VKIYIKSNNGLSYPRYEMRRRLPVHCASVDSPQPKDSDILDIIIIDPIIEDDRVTAAKDNRKRNLEELRNYIRNYIVGNPNVIRHPDYPETQSQKRKSYYHPFQVLASDGNPYPKNRDFFVRITYKYDSIGAEHSAHRKKMSKQSDYGDIYIGENQSTFNEAKAQAKAFIDGKVKEVERLLKTDPDSI